MKSAAAPQKAPTADDDSSFWDLRLYVAGPTPKSVIAFRNLEKLCEEHLAGRYRIEVIDLMKNPQLASHDQILAVPTLVRKLPSPIRKMIGSLSNTESVTIRLDLRSSNAPLVSTEQGGAHAG